MIDLKKELLSIAKTMPKKEGDVLSKIFQESITEMEVDDKTKLKTLKEVASVLDATSVKPWTEADLVAPFEKISPQGENKPPLNKGDKQGETIMATKTKTPKKYSPTKMLSRLQRLETFKRLGVKVQKWIDAEESTDHKATLAALQSDFNALDKARTDVLTRVSALVASGYTPPKKVVQGTVNLEPGRHVWIKPKYLTAYQEVFAPNMLNNLFVDKVASDGRLILSVGNPGDAVTMKFPVSKVQVSVKDPTEAVAA